MKKELTVLTETQERFIDYLTANLEKDNRIIFYKSSGYCGLEYALNSRFQNTQVLRYRELQKKHGKSIFFRVAHILSALITAIINHIKKVDVSENISNILENLENVYLGISKENEFLKFLKIKKRVHKYKRPKWIIRITDNDIQSSADIACLRLLCKLIHSKKINTTVLLLSGEKIEMLNISNNSYQNDLPHFQLMFKDVKLLAQLQKLQIVDSMQEHIEIIRKCGLQFFIDNYKHFNLLCEAHYDLPNWIKKIGILIDTLINENHMDNISSKQIYQLLEFASFFESSFTKLGIVNFKDNKLNAEHLNTACDLAIITQLQGQLPRYFFEIDAFKIYFNKKYLDDLFPRPKQVYKYFRKNYPFEYLAALKILNIDASIEDYDIIQSLIIIAYYYGNETKGFVNYEHYVRFTPKNSVALYLIELYEDFKCRKHQKLDSKLMSLLFNKLRNMELTAIAYCAFYCLILQILKENYELFQEYNFTLYLAEFKNYLLCITDDSQYDLYWQIHFKCQYIALSLEDEQTNMIFSRRLLMDTKKLCSNETIVQYIKSNHLRGFDRIELLSYSLEMEGCGETLKQLYESSEESTIIKELARINYSAYLNENHQYSISEKLLKKAHLSIISNINVDTYCAYLNNLYTAQLGAKSITYEIYIQCLEELLEHDVSRSDRMIVENNLYTVCLFCDEYIKIGEQNLWQNIDHGNLYNKFFAMHNLLSFYFCKNDVPKFQQIYSQIKVPKLLKSDTTLFLSKFKWMLEHIGTNIQNIKNKPISTGNSIYEDMYLIGSIERWFE